MPSSRAPIFPSHFLKYDASLQQTNEASVWTSEIFSMNVRAQAVGMASQTQNVANAIVQQFFPTFLANCGFYAVSAIFTLEKATRPLTTPAVLHVCRY